MFPELRTQTKAQNFRVPDLLVVRAGERFDRFVTQPPLIAIEILSPEDTVRAIQSKAAEYRNFGVEQIWVIDPAPRTVYRYTSAGLEMVQADELTVPETPIRVS